MFAPNDVAFEKYFQENGIADVSKVDNETASKIVSDLNRDGSWQFVCQCGFETSEEVVLDHVWTAMRFEHAIALAPKPTRTNRTSRLTPAEA